MKDCAAHNGMENGRHNIETEGSREGQTKNRCIADILADINGHSAGCHRALSGITTMRSPLLVRAGERVSEPNWQLLARAVGGRKRKHGTASSVANRRSVGVI